MNLIQGITGPRTPVEYKISVLQIRTPHDHKQVKEIVQVLNINTINNGYIMLAISNSSTMIQPNNLYVMNITASNPAGESVIIQNSTFST